MTHYDATFWVGANAVLRKSALDEIVETEHDGGCQIRRYIQDRTVIEDTESSIDLVRARAGRCSTTRSVSATAPRRRTSARSASSASAGRTAACSSCRSCRAQARERSPRGQRRRLGELFLRINYMASIFWSSVGLLAPARVPLQRPLLSPIVLVAALPYFLAMAGDLQALRLQADRRVPHLRVQPDPAAAGEPVGRRCARSARRSPARRSPSRARRRCATARPPPISFILVPYALIAFSVYTVWRDVHEGAIPHAVFAGFNALACIWALVALVGIRNSLVDIAIGIRERLYKSEKPVRYKRRRTPLDDTAVASDWRDVLYNGALADGRSRIDVKGAGRAVAGPCGDRPHERRRVGRGAGAGDRDDARR